MLTHTAICPSAAGIVQSTMESLEFAGTIDSTCTKRMHVKHHCRNGCKTQNDPKHQSCLRTSKSMP